MIGKENMELKQPDQLLDGQFKVIVDFQKSNDEETGKFLGFIEGFAGTTDLDREFDIIEDSAFKDGAKQLRASPAVFFNHQHQELPVGKLVKTKHIAGEGLYVKVGISKNQPNLWTAIDEGIINKFSVYGRFGDIEWTERAIKGEKRMVRKIKSAEFYEVSIVGMPANIKASFVQTIQKYFDLSTKPADSPETQKVEKNMELDNTTESTEEVEEIETDPAVIEETGNPEIEAIQKNVAGLTVAVAGMIESQKAFIESQAEVQKTQGTTVRKTATRKEPAADPPKFMSAIEWEIYEMEELAKLLRDPDAVRIDLYGTLSKQSAKGDSGLMGVSR